MNGASNDRSSFSVLALDLFHRSQPFIVPPLLETLIDLPLDCHLPFS